MTEQNLICEKDFGYLILRKPEADDQAELFRRLIAEDLEKEKEGDVVEKDGYRKVLFHDARSRCWLVDWRGKRYVFKLDRRRRHRVDYLVSSFFLGSNAFRLMRTLAQAWSVGFRGAAEIYLVADKRRFGCVLHSFFLLEYVDGENLQEEPQDFYGQYAERAAEIVRTLHGFGCAHGDAHRGNFILEKKTGQLKTIDIGGKVPSPSQKATDRLRLEKEWGVKNEVFDVGYYWVKLYKAWRHFHPFCADFHPFSKDYWKNLFLFSTSR